jgi:tRNA-Thr(GGU) m(6)t(6)A37 methyltransferase TsaA
VKDSFQIFPVGIILKQNENSFIKIYDKYIDALLGLDQFSHINVFYWFHKSDTPSKRNILRVYPRGKKSNPITGVFATHSPVRPNLIAFSTCKILSIDENFIKVDTIDAFDETPVIDIKPYIPISDSKEEAIIPGWVRR